MLLGVTKYDLLQSPKRLATNETTSQSTTKYISNNKPNEDGLTTTKTKKQRNKKNRKKYKNTI